MPNFEMPQTPQVEKDNEMEAYERTTAKVRELAADSESQEELEAKLEEAGVEYFQINWHNPGDEGFDSDPDSAKLTMDIFPGLYLSKNGAQVYVQTDPNAQF